MEESLFYKESVVPYPINPIIPYFPDNSLS
jgi:hypothetical protein